VLGGRKTEESMIPALKLLPVYWSGKHKQKENIPHGKDSVTHRISAEHREVYLRTRKAEQCLQGWVRLTRPTWGQMVGGLWVTPFYPGIRQYLQGIGLNPMLIFHIPSFRKYCLCYLQILSRIPNVCRTLTYLGQSRGTWGEKHLYIMNTHTHSHLQSEKINSKPPMQQGTGSREQG